jgi:hypothetical protein
MCLSLALKRPNDVLARGEHAGFHWIVMHNGWGIRCGYVRIPAGHPWHGADRNSVDPDVHGGVTFCKPDVPCDAGGPDDALWYGFDCGGAFDAPDPGLPCAKTRNPYALFLEEFPGDRAYHVWTQAEVEDECRNFCRQAAEAGRRADP